MKVRATSYEEKQIRRKQILDTTRLLYETTSFKDIKMADIAQKAGIAKGTLFLYFKTKEQLFLDLMMEEYHQWLEELDILLSNLEENETDLVITSLLDFIRHTFDSRKTMFRLLSILHSVLESNVATQDILSAKQALYAKASVVGKSLEQHLTFLDNGQGLLLINHIHAMFVGFKSMYDPAPEIMKAANEAGLPLYAKSFEDTILNVLRIYLLGLKTNHIASDKIEIS